jgi:RHS repeat-associated protein
MGAPADSSFYSMHAAVDNSSYFSGTRLFYFGSRYYDPELGIWLSVDPASQFANAYGYSSNPLLMVDKDGNFFWLIPVAIGAAVGAVQGYSMGKAKGAEGGSMFGYIFGGAIIGGISGYATAGVGNAVTGAVGTGLAGWSGAGFTAATVGGAAGSAVGGAISGFGTGLMSGASGGQIWEQMWKGAAFGGLSGGASSALCYGLSSSFRWETHKKVLKWANNHDAMDKAVKYSAGIQAGGKVDIKNSFYYKENSLKTPVGEGVAGSGQVSENAKPFIAVAKNGVIDNSGNFDPSRLWESVSHEVYESVKGHTHNQIYGGIMQANQYYKFWSKDTKDIISELKELYLQIEPW